MISTPNWLATASTSETREINERVGSSITTVDDAERAALWGANTASARRVRRELHRRNQPRRYRASRLAHFERSPTSRPRRVPPPRKTRTSKHGADTRPSYPQYVIYHHRIVARGAEVVVLGHTTGSHLDPADEVEKSAHSHLARQGQRRHVDSLGDHRGHTGPTRGSRFGRRLTQRRRRLVSSLFSWFCRAPLVSTLNVARLLPGLLPAGPTSCVTGRHPTNLRTRESAAQGIYRSPGGIRCHALDRPTDQTSDSRPLRHWRPRLWDAARFNRGHNVGPE